MIKNTFLFALNVKRHVFNELLNAVKTLREQGIEVSAESWIHNFVREELGVALSDRIADADFILSLGGDGTLLRAAQLAIKHNKPLLGVNAGRLGFLTEFDLSQLRDYLGDIKENHYHIEDRSLISIRINDKDYPVVNDVVISRGGYSRLVNFDVYCDQQFVSSYFADGLVLSTPTGSTGYSLSAGGPIMMPDVESFVITPICAHSLLHRSIVVSNDKHLEIRLKNDTDLKSQLILDGITVKSLSKNESIRVCKSDRVLKLIRFSNRNFFEIVQKKLIEWK